MKLTNKYVDLEHAKLLKEAGIIIESEYTYEEFRGLYTLRRNLYVEMNNKDCPAPDVSELLEFFKNEKIIINNNASYFNICLDREKGIEFENANLSNALTDLCIWVRKEGLK